MDASIPQAGIVQRGLHFLQQDAATTVTNPFPGIPLIRSPIFATQRGSMGLTEEEDRIAIDLNERGYAVLDFPDPRSTRVSIASRRTLGLVMPASISPIRMATRRR
jgi:hypothetical protein